MKINTSDKIIAWLTLFSGLSISAVAVWYSVAGLVSIFAAAAIPIIIMGVALEISKLVATVWVKLNWQRAPRLIKIYLCSAIAVLMLITSMGIFGYLSKAHLDQAVPTGDVADKVALIDEKIKTQRDNIDAARKALRQMDESVDQTMARSSDEKGADKAAALRRGQQRERSALQSDIAKAQSAIAVLNEERAPIAKELRKVEAEVGPIKYIAALLYGDNPDQNLLEAAVRWVIIIIVLVFDPLAVILLLASQYSFHWFRKDSEEEKSEPVHEDDGFKFLADEKDLYPEESDKKAIWPAFSSMWPFPRNDVSESNKLVEEAPYHPGYEDVAITDDAGINEEEKNSLDDWNKMIAEAEKAVEEEKELEDHEILDRAADSEKEAMSLWKADNPDSSLKFQRRLYDSGAIDTLPWEKYLKAQPDFSDNDAAEEAAKWALEQVEKKKEDHGHYIGLDSKEESKKKDNDVDGTSRQSTDKEIQRRIEGYIQNAEQGENTIWTRIKDVKKD
jgi:hypothetical protein